MHQHHKPPPALTDNQIDELLARAVERLAVLALNVSILILEPGAASEASESGWRQIGCLRDARGRFWYRVLWHADSGEGRMVRERPRPSRDALGGVIPGIETSR